MLSHMGPELPASEIPSSVSSLYPMLEPDHADKDHFRQLVLASELPHIPESELMRLATAATDMAGVEEVSLRQQHQYCCLSLSREALDERRRQITALDPSDSDGLGDGPLLGRGSRVRRARSSRLHTANSGRTSTSLDQQYLFQHLDDASSYTSSDSGHVNPAFVQDQASHMTATRSFRHARSNENGSNVKKQGGGSAMKSDTSDVQRENKQEFLAPKHSSIRPRPRPKTARANRVAPSCTDSVRRTGSAAIVSSIHQDMNGNVEPPASPPDPLDAWSTRNIANMNALLEWGKDDESL